MYLFALCDLFYISIVFRFDGFKFHPFLERISTKQNVSTKWNAQGAEWNGSWMEPMEWKMHFNKISMMKLWINYLHNWIQVNWINNVDRAVSSAIGLNKRKYLRSSINPMCYDVYYDALVDFIRHYLKRDRHKSKERGWKNNAMNLYLVILSFIVDIWPGSEYPSDEQNKLFIFSKKANLKVQ